LGALKVEIIFQFFLF